MKRRDFIKGLMGIPFIGYVVPKLYMFGKSTVESIYTVPKGQKAYIAGEALQEGDAVKITGWDKNGKIRTEKVFLNGTNPQVTDFMRIIRIET